MRALLYYSISLTLTEDEIIEVDRRVAKERKAVYIFVRNFASNGKNGTQRIILIIALGSVVWFSNLDSAEAIGLLTPPTPVVRVQPNYKDTYETKVAPTVSPKLDKISFIKYRELQFGSICCNIKWWSTESAVRKYSICTTSLRC
uniref:Uncharacterized protein n=1 Tax=Cylindrotheca closterium TaxID=2856 RepID=A0A023IP31_9STRA|nr:hypothetical protein [Cylindrotheca closterium]AGY78396.1 hypothetical protein [Cylindrotheca closterium]